MGFMETTFAPTYYYSFSYVTRKNNSSPVVFCLDIWSFIVTIVLKLGERQFLACRTGVIFSRFSGVRKRSEAGVERETTAASPVARVSRSTSSSRRYRSPEKHEKNIIK